MNTIILEGNRFELPECWIYWNHQYILHNNKRWNGNLPFVEKKYEFLLKQLNIPYRNITDKQGYDICEYWNPDFYQEEVVCLPMYVSTCNGRYRYVKMYSQKIPSDETIKYARAIENIVLREIRQYERKLAQIEWGRTYKKILKGRPAIGTFLADYESYSSEVFTDIAFENEHYKVIRLTGKSKYGSSFIAVFDVNRIEMNSIVELVVPKGMEGLFVGKNGCQVKKWCEILGLKKINVVSET